MNSYDDWEIENINPRDIEKLKKFYEETKELIQKFEELKEELKNKWAYASSDISSGKDLLFRLKEEVFKTILKPFKNLPSFNTIPLEKIENFEEIYKYAKNEYMEDAEKIAYQNILNNAKNIYPSNIIKDGQWVKTTPKDLLKVQKSGEANVILRVFTEKNYDGMSRLSYGTTEYLVAVGKLLEVIFWNAKPSQVTGDILLKHYNKIMMKEIEGAFERKPIGLVIGGNFQDILQYCKIYKNGKMILHFTKKRSAEKFVEILTGEREYEGVEEWS